ncbi:MAG: hypothetical protein U0Y82_11080 [Thermoleophilia bacterium]
MRAHTRMGAGVLALAALAGSAQMATAKDKAAQSSLLAGSECAALTYSQALLGLGDTNLYTLAPQGSFEDAIDGWRISGGASVVGDAGYPAGPVADTRALELSPGASATSPPVCANASTPIFRYFVRAMAANAGDYTVSVEYLDAYGGKVKGSLNLAAGTAWKPSPKLGVQTNKIATDASGWGHIQITLTAPANSALRIDDLYMDPKMR